jgi:hypothetical protein
LPKPKNTRDDKSVARPGCRPVVCERKPKPSSTERSPSSHTLRPNETGDLCFNERAPIIAGYRGWRISIQIRRRVTRCFPVWSHVGCCAGQFRRFVSALSACHRRFEKAQYTVVEMLKENAADMSLTGYKRNGCSFVGFVCEQQIHRWQRKIHYLPRRIQTRRRGTVRRHRACDGSVAEQMQL